MKKIIITIVAVLLVALTVCSCSSAKDKNSRVEEGATNDEANYPTPEENLFVESKGETGLRFGFTLDKFTTEFNTMYENIGGDPEDFPYKKWKKKSSNESADNGLNYEYYSLKSSEITLTATVEAESRELVNVGCGLLSDKFYKNQNTEQKVLTICGVIAAVSGGYSRDSVPFFSNLYVDTISNKEHAFWYNNAIYLFEEDSNQGVKVIFFRTMPAADDIESRWALQDYKQFWFK